MNAESGESVIFETAVSDIQSGVSVIGNRIVGKLKNLTSGAIAEEYGSGYYIALKFSGIDSEARSVRVGVEPSDAGLIEIINDPDKNGVFKITDKDAQIFKIISTDSKSRETTQIFSLSSLILEA